MTLKGVASMGELIRAPDPAIVALRCHSETLGAACDALDLDAPMANRFTERAGILIAAIGPDDWLVIADDTESPVLEQRLQAALAGHHAAVVDVSGNRVRYRLDGPDAATLLAHGCSIDLERLPVGSCIGTLLARAQIILLKRDSGFDLFPRRSFAAYVEAWFASGVAPHAVHRG